MMNKLIAILIPGLTAGILLGSCKKEESTDVSGIPFVQVEVNINLNNPAYFDLSIPGGWIYYPAGSKGLIIYRKNQTDFIAMDRHCPYRPQDGCSVDVDQSAVFAEDDCCGSQFGINDGSILQGPATQSLRIYNTTYDGVFLRVFN